MKWRIDPPADASAPVSVQLMIRHPNNSGLAMDQVTHLYDPPYYVRNVRVTRGDELVFAADVDFSISENPAFRFTLRPGTSGTLHARVADSNERVFESSAPGYFTRPPRLLAGACVQPILGRPVCVQIGFGVTRILASPGRPYRACPPCQ
jgi:hypothetical protein